MRSKTLIICSTDSPEDRWEEIKINMQENLLDLTDRNFQKERATGHLEKGMRMNPNRGHFHGLRRLGAAGRPLQRPVKKASRFHATDQEL